MAAAVTTTRLGGLRYLPSGVRVGGVQWWRRRPATQNFFFSFFDRKQHPHEGEGNREGMKASRPREGEASCAASRPCRKNGPKYNEWDSWLVKWARRKTVQTKKAFLLLGIDLLKKINYFTFSLISYDCQIAKEL